MKIVLERPAGFVNFSSSESFSAAIRPPDWVFAGADPCLTSPVSIELAGQPASLNALSPIDSSLALTSLRLHGARGMDRDRLRDAVVDLYRCAREQLCGTPFLHLVRVWQFVPGIHDDMGGNTPRYQVFNEGRFQGFEEWFGSERNFQRTLPAATAVGTMDEDLCVYFLSACTPGFPVENPMQRSAFRYSRKFGFRPPCFARATAVRLGSERRLYIAGTASIQGEESVNPTSLADQLRVTLTNLARVVRASGLTTACASDEQALASLTTARAYHLRMGDRLQIESALHRALPGVTRLEILQADICRRELLVEVEGVAVSGLEPPVAPAEVP